jgi:predicted ATP-dependent serine protease
VSGSRLLARVTSSEQSACVIVSGFYGGTVARLVHLNGPPGIGKSTLTLTFRRL